MVIIIIHVKIKKIDNDIKIKVDYILGIIEILAQIYHICTEI